MGTASATFALCEPLSSLQCVDCVSTIQRIKGMRRTRFGQKKTYVFQEHLSH
jgi:hypothetical protein